MKLFINPLETHLNSPAWPLETHLNPLARALYRTQHCTRDDLVFHFLNSLDTPVCIFVFSSFMNGKGM